MLRVGGLDTNERAADIARACRLHGETIRRGLDCLVAAVAIREGVTVLHADRDFDAIARHTALRVEPIRRSRRPRRQGP
jgi:predicted nucleic acid-binding protein